MSLPRALALLSALAPLSAVADVPYVNFENHPVHALDLSPDHHLLAAAHTADARVQLFDVSTGEPVAIGHVPVGIDPVAVRFRTDNELWVVNHISDSVSVVDIASRTVRATLSTADEPFDVVFARGKAFVSCSQANRVLVFDTADLSAPPQSIAIVGEDPRALAVSPDGNTVYAAIFESGNSTTILAGGQAISRINVPNVVNDPRGPYQGVNPPPNRGTTFDPPLLAGSTPPRVGLIVRQGDDGKWRDDNQGDWTRLVSGDLASVSGRRVGWNLADHDIAIIDAQSLAVRYASGLMNIGMALAVNPASGTATLVGTEALNEVRFEPNVNSRFVRVHLAQVRSDGSKQRVDLNSQLDYASHTLPKAQRDRALSDPRAILWRGDGQRGWVAGLGSNNVVTIDASGARVGKPIAVGQGPAGLALDEAHARLYVWNHFEASLSVVDTGTSAELSRLAVFNPLPQAIRDGRPLLYDSHLTSGLGQASCASCHVDARMDKLAWDLGDPSQPSAHFDQNCVTTVQVDDCEDFHAMKGPMTTQTLQDIIGHEPFHWRGDRAGLEAFNPAFQTLLGNDRQLTASEMQKFENFLATITFPPNPNRNFDNTLPSALPLPGHYSSGRFSMAGQPLPAGDANRGLRLYTQNFLDAPLQCANCHTLPTGMAVNGPTLLSVLGIPVGGSVMPHGPNGENHLGIVSIDGSTNVSMKVPQLRNQYEKTGFEFSATDNTAGFGFLHDGSVDSLSKFLSAPVFSVGSDRDVADLVALTLAFSGSDFGDANPRLGAPAPLSKDAVASVGAQLTLTSNTTPPARIGEMLDQARAGKIDLVAHGGGLGYTFDRASDRFLVSDGGTAVTPAELRARASVASPQTWTVVPAGLGKRLGIDRDGDGVADQLEIQQGSDPADAASKTTRGLAGLWFNPQRSGHGLDVQYLGANLFVTWYTYADDGTPTWYLAVGPNANPWSGQLDRYTFDPAGGRVVGQSVGQLKLNFSSASRATFDWTLGNRSGSEVIQPLVESRQPALPDHTGTWYDPLQPGWGVSVYTVADVQVAIAYFYDGANQPRWAIGQGHNSPATALAMTSYQGFCPACAVAPLQPSNAGELRLDYRSARSALTSSTLRYPAQAANPWQRGPVLTEPLSDMALRPELR